KINVFMGEQSSGKSTIAKIISFCTWLDKKYARDGFFSVLKNEELDIPNYIEELKSYHRLTNGYFSDNSSIAFDGEEITFSYNCDFISKEVPTTIIEDDNNFKIGLKTGKRRQSDKVIYIPSERNFVSAIYNLNEYLRDRDLIQDFVNNWYEAKRKYSKEHKLRILELGVQYHNEGDDIDKLTLDNGQELTLQIASSGLQAVTPLITLFDYIARGIYSDSRPMSVSERDKMVKQYNEMVKQRKEGGAKINTNDLQTLFDLIVSRNYNQSQFIIEEPEQNLFPTTQRDLIYYMLRVLNESKQKHRLTFTTHSPYILYALNNCMMGGLVYNKMSDNDKDKLKCKSSMINPTDVSVYQIYDGKLKGIQQDDKLIGSNYLDQNMKELMDDFYVMLNYYE
ncbi:ATP-binding protein, partial [Bacteroidales bacterium OttesenSCG-928-C19]|nr:ATP-binding protein [Bacteroidales bacterium OttesenSCG-928-C19]